MRTCVFVFYWNIDGFTMLRLNSAFQQSELVFSPNPYLCLLFSTPMHPYWHHLPQTQNAALLFYFFCKKAILVSLTSCTSVKSLNTRRALVTVNLCWVHRSWLITCSCHRVKGQGELLVRGLYGMIKNTRGMWLQTGVCLKIWFL